MITGTLESMSREEARAALEALGAKVSDNVSKKTTGVFVGESPGSKVAKAREGRRAAARRGRPAGSCYRVDASAVAKRSCALRADHVDTGQPFCMTANT